MTGSVDLSISGNSVSDVAWRIYDLVNFDSFGNPAVLLQLDVTSGAAYAEALTLGAGQYAVELIASVDAGSSYSGTFGNFAIVPAPGAVAVMAFAGLGGRRRRA